MPVAQSARDSWDTLQSPSRPDSHWSTDNVGEAAPGVLSTLGWSLWRSCAESTTRRALWSTGALTNAELRVPERVEDRVVGVFYGRIALMVEWMGLLGDRLPGTSGEELVGGFLGSVPDTIEFHPTVRRYPFIAWRLPRTFLTFPRRLRAETPATDRWWRASVDELATADLPRARALLREAATEFDMALELQSIGVVAVQQPLLDAVTRLVEETGRGDVGVLSGSGGAEMAVIGDIWKASRGQATLADVVARHGFHGPLEGEVSSRVWREDPAPLERMIDAYAKRSDSEDPFEREAAARARLPEMQREVLAAVPPTQRLGTRLLLGLAAERIPSRGVAKRSFIQAIDVARASARRIGHHLAEAGRLDDPEDVIHLTLDELLGLPVDARELVAKRSERRAAYQALRIPSSWTGVPEPEPESEDAEAVGAKALTGVGVSRGVVEGAARVVTDPSFAEVEPDEILVAPTTDPSWASIMFISAGLVVDIGGAMSHAAVVARELGLPCVVNTKRGTEVIRDGDVIRVDGAAGTVEILS